MIAPCRTLPGRAEGVDKLKRYNWILLGIMAAAVVLFAGYEFWLNRIQDVTGPVITLEEGLLEISVKDSEEALLQGLKAVDDRDGDVTASVLVERIEGINEDHVATVTYAAIDSAGNVTKLQRQVRYRDYTSPRFRLYGSLTFAAGTGFDVMEYVGAEDVREGDIRRRVHAALISDTESVSEVGYHLVRFQVVNDLGDSQEIELPVEVYDPEWYKAQVTLTDYLIYIQVGERIKPREYLDTFVVRGESVDVSRSIPEGVSFEMTNGVDFDTPGVYEVTYQLSQNLNLTTYSGIAKLIVVVEE